MYTFSKERPTKQQSNKTLEQHTKHGDQFANNKSYMKGQVKLYKSAGKISREHKQKRQP